MVIKSSVVKLCIMFMCAGISAGAAYKSVCGVSRSAFSVNDRLTVICDAGHGAPDGGAVGVNGVLEKDINLAIVLKLREVLEGKGINVILTREGDSGLHSGTGTIREMKLEDMHRRRDIMNGSNADLFISVHMNSFTGNAEGVHVFYDKTHDQSKELAQKINDTVCKTTGARAHDVSEAASSLYLMKNTPLPAVLVECGFISNAHEAELLADEQYQSKLAWAIGKAVAEYFKNQLF